MPSFELTAHQNEYLPADAAEVNAVVTVASTGGQPVDPTTGGQDKAVVLIVDTSGSMGMPDAKIRAARRAATTAVEMLPDGTLFAVIAGSHESQCVYPSHAYPALVRADERTRREAAAAVAGLRDSGGTAISTWLGLARTLFERHPGAIRLAYLLTDGRNESEAASLLQAELDRCVGVFQCDCRGVGEAWEVAELRHIASTLLGEVDIIAQPDDMDDDFAAFLERAIGKNVADVRLRMWSPQGATVRFVRQVAPIIEDLTGKATQVNPLTRDFPTGAWSGDESRDYHVCIDVVPGAVGIEKLAARVTLMVGDDQAGQSLVRAVWTDDESLSTRISPQVAHYTGQAELAQAIQDGLEARKSGDDVTATVKLGRAVQLAHESGNDGTMRLLRKVVDVEDEATGTIRVKRNVETLDEMELDTRSTRTVRVGRPTGQPAPPVEAIP
jgi:VWA domain-containing protein